MVGLVRAGTAKDREARRVRDSQFSETERKRLATAQQLLAVALDQSATPAERQIAYRRVRDEVDGLLALSDEAVERLEKKVALQLDAGTTPPQTGTSPPQTGTTPPQTGAAPPRDGDGAATPHS